MSEPTTECVVCEKAADPYRCHVMTHDDHPGVTFHVHPECFTPAGKAVLARKFPHPISRDIAHDLARALHAATAFLPVFAEPSRKTTRAQEAMDQADAALDAYCSAAGIRVQDLNDPEAWR